MDKIKRPKLYTLPDALQTVQHPHRPDLPRAACLVSSADRCSVSSVWACVSCLAWSTLHLARSVLLPAVPGALGLGSPPGGNGAGGPGGRGESRLLRPK